tara:strand:- start:307 stop:1059 length:753 start_codon:yes stop_codon:yes gene_type:complete
MDTLLKFFLFLLIFFNINTLILADTIIEERKFNIYAKLPLLPKIAIMEIDTSLNIKNNKYRYDFNIKSKNIVKFINQVDGMGKVSGIFNNSYQPTEYEYSYKRKNKEKFVKLNYLDNEVVNIITIPKFDKNELSEVTGEMLLDTIDPSTFFLTLLNFNLTDNCNKLFKIFDGKRRYNIVFKNKFTDIINKTIECEADQIKIGGYKTNEKDSDVFASSDFIKIIYSNDRNNTFKGYEARNGSIKIFINEIN